MALPQLLVEQPLEEMALPQLLVEQEGLVGLEELVEQVLGVPWPAESLLDLVPEWLVKELAQNQLGLEAEVHWKVQALWVDFPVQELAQEEQGEVELCILVALVLAPPHHHRTHQAEE